MQNTAKGEAAFKLCIETEQACLEEIKKYPKFDQYHQLFEAVMQNTEKREAAFKLYIEAEQACLEEIKKFPELDLQHHQLLEEAIEVVEKGFKESQTRSVQKRKRLLSMQADLESHVQ
jgi:hypothetical protein